MAEFGWLTRMIVFIPWPSTPSVMFSRRESAWPVRWLGILRQQLAGVVEHDELPAVGLLWAPGLAGREHVEQVGRARAEERFVAGDHMGRAPAGPSAGERSEHMGLSVHGGPCHRTSRPAWRRAISVFPNARRSTWPCRPRRSHAAGDSLAEFAATV
jgi:hypothetical protein